MMIYRLHYRQRLPISLETAWDFFSVPHNLAEITPPWLGFEVTSDNVPDMYPGMVIIYRLRPFGAFPVRWVTEITQARRPLFFVDEQRFGPYRFWHHQHLFRPIDGGLEMEDVVHYILPGGWVGDMVFRRSVRRRLVAIFVFRRQRLTERFGSHP